VSSKKECLNPVSEPADSVLINKSARIPVSVLILTLNEEINMARCIAALDWSDDIVVLDSFSTDATRKIAAELGARVFERPFDSFAEQRNFALDNIKFKHSWILHLDADEVVTGELRDELANAVAEGLFKAFKIPSKLIFQDKWLRYSGMYPCYQVRLGHIDALRFEQSGHGQRESLTMSEVGTLRNPYLHFGFSKGLSDWIERHNRYSSDEAQLALSLTKEDLPGWVSLLMTGDKTVRRRILKAKVANWPFRASLRFVYMYVIKFGFLDGRKGFTYCRLLAMYEYWIELKLRELRQNKGQGN